LKSSCQDSQRIAVSKSINLLFNLSIIEKKLLVIQ